MNEAELCERAIDSTAANLRMPPPERIESAIRRGRKIRRRRLALGAMASAVVAAALIVPLLLLLPLHERPAPNPQGSGRLSRFGIGVDLPDGWQGTISYPSGTLGPVLQATNFPLASPLPFEGSSFYSGIRAIPDQGIAVAMQEFVGLCGCEGFTDGTFPPSVSSSDLMPWGGQAYAAKTFQVDGQGLALYVEFGTQPVTEDQLALANAVLSTLSVDPTPPPSLSPTDPDTYAAPSFQLAEGWNTTSSVVSVNSGDAPIAWATNVPVQASDLALVPRGGLPLYPGDTLRQLPADGIILVAALMPTGGSPAPDHNPNFPDLELPLQLSEAHLQADWEGRVAPNLSRYRILARVNDQYLDVQVYFGTLTPDDATTSTAQQELDRLLVPEGP